MNFTCHYYLKWESKKAIINNKSTFYLFTLDLSFITLTKEVSTTEKGFFLVWQRRDFAGGSAGCLRRNSEVSFSKGKFKMSIGWLFKIRAIQVWNGLPRNEVGVPQLLWGHNNGLVMYDSLHNGYYSYGDFWTAFLWFIQCRMEKHPILPGKMFWSTKLTGDC